MNGPDELVTVATFATAVEASVARGALEAAGITAIAPSETSVHGLNRAKSQFVWAELQVRAVDRERAENVLTSAGYR